MFFGGCRGGGGGECFKDFLTLTTKKITITLHNNIAAVYLFKNNVQIYRISFSIAPFLIIPSLGIGIPLKDHHNTLVYINNMNIWTVC